MSPPRRGPALYELIRDKPRVRVPVDGDRPAREPSAPVVGGGAPQVFSGAGRSIRVPMGYVFLAVAAGIALLFLGFFIGHSRANSKAMEERRAQSAALLEDSVADPLAELGSRVNPQSGQPSANPPVRPSGSGTPAGASNAGRASAAVGLDPRAPGLNYFICARLRESEAVRAAEFLSANGVAAAVTPADNPSLRLVVATRGFTREEMRGGEATGLRSRITSLGRIYKDQHKGPTNFHDVYPEKYQP